MHLGNATEDYLHNKTNLKLRKYEQAITLAIQFFDKTTFTNPGPATEHDSIISDGGRFFMMAYTNKNTQNDHLMEPNQKFNF